MLCFIDESGDPGLKLGAGSSPHFVVALVVFNDHDAADHRRIIKHHEIYVQLWPRE
jgi:hypothetical protein